MKPLPQKLVSFLPEEKRHAVVIDTLIDHLTDYEAEQDRRLTELRNRVQEISNLQLEIKRGTIPVGSETEYGFEDNPYQPKRWRAKECENYWYVSDMGYLIDEAEVYNLADNFRHAIGNYHPTREAAEAYKARLLELGKEI